VVGEGGVTALTVAGRRRQLEAAVVLLQHGCPVGSMAEHESYARFLRLAQQRAGKVRIALPAAPPASTRFGGGGGRGGAREEDAAAAADRAMRELLETEEREEAEAKAKAQKKAAKKVRVRVNSTRFTLFCCCCCC
jgi:RNA-splicing ligase RtcB